MSASYDPDSNYYQRPHRKPVRGPRNSLYANASSMAYPMETEEEVYMEHTSAHPGYGGSNILGQRPIDEEIVEAKQQLRLLKDEQRELYRQRLIIEERHAKDARFEQRCHLVAGKLSQTMVEFQERAQHARAEAQVLQQMADAYRNHLQTMHRIRPEAWRSQGIFKELDRALAILDEGESILQKGHNRLQQMARKTVPAHLYRGDDDSERRHGKKGFFYWLRVGFYVSLPFAAFLAIGVILILTAIQQNGL